MSDRNQAEWLLLQQLTEQMEKQALWLKVVAMLGWLVLIQTESSLLLQGGLIGLFWLHEAIWRTQQSRNVQRLLQLEQAISQDQQIGCLWQTAWAQSRPGMLGLVLSYLQHSLKPTVMLTYLILIAGSLLRHFN